MRIRTRLLLLLLATAVGPTLAVGLLASRGAERSLAEAVAREHLRTALDEAGHVSSDVLSLTAELGEALRQRESGGSGPARTQEWLERVFLRRESLALVGLFDARGRMTACVFVDDAEAFARREPQFGHHATVAAPEVEDFRRRAQVLLARLGPGQPSAVSEPYLTAVRQRPAVVVVTPEPGAPGGALAAELGLEELSRRLAAGGADAGRVFLLDGRGRLLLSGDAERERRREDFSAKLPGVLGAERPGQGEYDEEGRTWLAAFSPVPRLPWVAVVARPREAALAPLRALTRGTLEVLGFTLVAVLALVPLLARALVRPLGRLVEGSREVARGHLSHRLEAGRPDELGDLARAFNEMGQALEEARHELVGHNARLQEQVEQRTQELQRMQARLSRSQRLAAIGDLAAGMAHEVNNPLAAILGNVQLLLMDLPDSASTPHRMLSAVQQQAQRITHLVRELQLLSERQQGGRLPLDLHRVLHRVLEARGAELTRGAVRVACHFHPGEVKVLGDMQALGDVFGRLLGNALTALEDRPERTLTVRTQLVDGQWVRVELCDTGRGIPREHLERIFNPFFSTRQQWSGKGLSLAVCHRVVEDHAGTISLHSDEGVGTTVTLLLPTAPVATSLV